MRRISNLAYQLLQLPCRELLVSRIDFVEDSILRVETKLMRSNGTYVDLFIEANPRNGTDHSDDIIKLSDFGITWDYLFDLAKPVTDSSLAYIAKCYDLQLDGRALSKSCTISDFLASVLTLAQACVTLSGPLLDRAEIAQVTRGRDLVGALSREIINLPIAARPATSMTVIDTVIDSLSRSHREFEMAAPIHLPAYEVKVDILVRTKRLPAALMIVEHSPYERVTMRRADHAFAIHTDLRDARWRGTRYSVVDQEDVEREHLSDSFQRLHKISKLIAASDFQKEDLEAPN